MKESKIITSEEVERIVYEYVPKKFTSEVTQEAIEYVADHQRRASDFHLSELSAQQSGISKLNREKQDQIVDDLVLEKLKDLQENAYREAYELGVAEGAEKAFVEMKQDFLDRLEKIDDVLKSFDEVKKRLFDHNETHLIELMYLIAKKISFFEIEQDRDFIKKFVSILLEEVHGEESIVIKLCPDDLFFLEGLRDRNLKELEALKNVKLEGDDVVSPGGCKLETNYGVIDASLETRVEKVWELLKSRFPRLSDEERELQDDSSSVVKMKEPNVEVKSEPSENDGGGSDPDSESESA